MSDSRRQPSPAPETASRDDADHHLPDDGEHRDPPEEASASSEPDTSAPDDDGWLPV